MRKRNYTSKAALVAVFASAIFAGTNVYADTNSSDDSAIPVTPVTPVTPVPGTGSSSGSGAATDPVIPVTPVTVIL